MGKSRQPAEQCFRAGQIVPDSGIYAVAHARQHRSAHCILLLVNEVFPGCATCGGEVIFHLLRSAPYLWEDEDFRPEPPNPSKPAPRSSAGKAASRGPQRLK